MIKKVLKWTGLIVMVAFVVLVVYRGFVLQKVQNIFDTQITLADINGDNLPPDPGAAADKTIAGVDANENGIRDDVELAIFERTNDLNIRAAQLQYTKALQVWLTNDSSNGDVEYAAFSLPGLGLTCIQNVFAQMQVDSAKAGGKQDVNGRLLPDREEIRSMEEQSITAVRELVFNTDPRFMRMLERPKKPHYIEARNFASRICEVDSTHKS